MLDPRQPVFERVQFIQKDVVGDLPPLNQGGSPKLGTICRLNNGQFWCVVVDDLSPTLALIWQQIGGGGGSSLPDQRFTVGRGAYALNPNPATFTTIAAGIAAAAAGTGTTLGAAAAGSQRFVWVMPDAYTEAIALRPYVHVDGAGGAAESARLIGDVTYNGGTGYVVVSNLHFTGSTINLAPLAGSKLVLIFENCTFEGVTYTLTTLGGDTLTDVTVIFNGCTGQLVQSTCTIAAGDVLSHRFVGEPSTGTGEFAPRRGLQFGTTPTFTGPGTVTVSVSGGQRLTANGFGGPMLQFTGEIAATVETEDCTLETGNLQASVFRSTSGNNTPATWVCKSGTKVVLPPRSYWATTTAARFVGGELEVLSNVINDASAPLDAISGGTVTAELYPSNRERAAQEFLFSVPASQAQGGGPYADAAAAVAAMTVNGLIQTSAYFDEYRVVVEYDNPTTDPLDPNSANFATTFRYATFLLKDPSLLEDGRQYVVKNASDPSSATAGPFALRLPNGSTARIEYKQSDAGVNAIFNLANYVILLPGQSVVIEVDRQGANNPSYIVTSDLVSLPGSRAEPDQRFTVAPDAYALDNPGTNTFTTLDDGVAAAQAGTGTTLPPVSASSQRFVWVHPATYAAGQDDLRLRPFIHIEGTSNAPDSVVFSGYTFTFDEQGYIVISGVTFENCLLNIAPVGNTTIVFSNCRFTNTQVAHNQVAGPESTLRFIGCSGDFSSFSESGSGYKHLEFYGDSTASISHTGSGLGDADSKLIFTAPITGTDAGQTEIIIKSGQRVEYLGGHLLFADSAYFLLRTYACTIIVPSGIGQIFRLINSSNFDWQYLAGTMLDGQPSSFFDVDATSAANVSAQQIGVAFPNAALLSRPLDPVSGGSILSTVVPSNISFALDSSNINPVAGTPVAAQTAQMLGGFNDVFYVQCIYQANAVLQPDTTLPNFLFGSFELIDPLYLPEGREITIVNSGDPANNQRAFALRLPNGSSSRIGLRQSDISVNTTFDAENYIILQPGESVKLMVVQSSASPAYWVSAQGTSSPASVSPGWLEEAMFQYAVMPPTAAGSNTTGTLFFARKSGVSCVGGRFYWGDAAPRTVRVSLYGSTSGLVRSVNVATTGPGIYQGNFATPAAINGSENWFITFWEVTGSVYQNASIVPANRVSQLREYPAIIIVRSDGFAGGNAIPSIFSGLAVYYLIEPLITVS